MKRMSNEQYQRMLRERTLETHHENNVARLLKAKSPGAFHEYFDKTAKVKSRKGIKVVPNTHRVSDAPLASGKPKPIDIPAARRAQAAYEAARLQPTGTSKK